MRKQSGYVPEKKTQTPSNDANAVSELVQEFAASRKVLILDELPRLSGVKLTRKYTLLVDHFLRKLLPLAGLTPDTFNDSDNGRIAVIALGGYGSMELCFGSDVDLMILYEKERLPYFLERSLLRLFYGLWDAKLDVGYSIVNLIEAQKLIKKEFESLTSVIPARLVAGSRSLAREARALFLAGLEEDREGFFRRVLEARAERERKFDKEVFLLEPELKEGLGGLRDLDYMRWVSRVCLGVNRFSDLSLLSEFSHFDLNQLYHARGFLLKIRNYLHSMAERKEDRLLLEYQRRLATILGYGGSISLSGTDRFMKEVYLHMNRVRYAVEEFLVKVGDILFPAPVVRASWFLPSEFRLVKGNLVIKEMELLDRDPDLILRALNIANRHNLHLGSGLIWKAKGIVARLGSRLASSESAKGLFVDLITNPNSLKTMRLALELGLICAFIPEFKRIRNLAQFGYYHVETVDLHLLSTLHILGGIRDGAYEAYWPLLQNVWNELKNPGLLCIAGLLHDIGKGYGRGHSLKGGQIVEGIVERLGFGREASRAVSFLVRHHLLLSRVSQRRDLGEEKTVIQVAQTVQDPDLLNMLFLLSVADSMATGPAARSHWKHSLLEELFFKVRKVIKGGAFATPDATKRAEEKKQRVAKALEREFGLEAVEEMLEQLSIRYLLSVDIPDMIDQLRLALTMGEKRYSWVLKTRKGTSVTKILQCTYDMPGLFSKMVGAFTINDIRVLSANIFTLRNGMALDIYEVTNPLDPLRESERWEKVYGDILAALEGRISLEELIKRRKEAKEFLRYYDSHIRSKIMIDNEVSDFFTVIEGTWPYRPGILYEVATILNSLELDIRFAKVNIDKERMAGAFYVRDKAGQKVFEQEELEIMRKKLKGPYDAGRNLS